MTFKDKKLFGKTKIKLSGKLGGRVRLLARRDAPKQPYFYEVKDRQSHNPGNPCIIVNGGPD